MDKRHLGIICSIAICFLVLLLLWPLDMFTHGYYPDEIDIEQIDSIDIIGSIKVNDPDCAIVFSPQKKYFAGMELYFTMDSPEAGGIMTMTVSDSAGKLVDSVEINLDEVNGSEWFKVYTNAKYKKGAQYTARFSLSETVSAPSFLLVNPSYLGDETVEGSILVSYAYAMPTFSFQEKILLSALALAVLGAIILAFTPDLKSRMALKNVLLICFLTIGMTWNYMYNSFDVDNTRFPGFLSICETLAAGPIYAERDGLYALGETEGVYGLGAYRDLKGLWTSYDMKYITDDDWNEGYSRTEPQIIVSANRITRVVIVPGNYIRFRNGEEYTITEISDDGDYIVVSLDSERLLTRARNGNLDDCSIFNADHSPISKTSLQAYVSQYGMQGKIFRRLARYMSEEDKIANLNLLCSFAAASVFMLIVILLAKKYNTLLSGCYFIVFAFSPWIVNYARNLYWVEFCWFIPMAIGLICSMKIGSAKWRTGCYIATFIAIMVKSLCGYEFITTVMMGLITFMVVDLLLAIVRKDKEKAGLLFKATVIMGILALAGFAAAICIHARVRGGGDIIEGVKIIIKNDVLRRTNGADLNDFDPAYWPSMNASTWEVLCFYFHFSTEVILGIRANMFPLLCTIPLAIFAYEADKKKADYNAIFMYGFTFLSSISWFCLAKSHSYIHTHMNYVMWYFGFVQTCIYVIVSRFLNLVKGRF